MRAGKSARTSSSRSTAISPVSEAHQPGPQFGKRCGRAKTMCHIALLLPLLALPVLWIWPLAVSVPVYAVVAIVAALVYWYAILAMRRPVETGAEGMTGATGEVVESHGTSLILRIGGEIWSGRSATALCKGERVEVIAVERLVLMVRRLDATTPSSSDTQPLSPGRRVAGA